MLALAPVRPIRAAGKSGRPIATLALVEDLPLRGKGFVALHPCHCFALRETCLEVGQCSSPWAGLRPKRFRTCRAFSAICSFVRPRASVVFAASWAWFCV